MNTDKSLAVVDLGGQYCHLISRRLRDLDVWSDILDADVSPDVLKNYAGVILSGGPRSVNDKHAPTVDRKILDLGKPILGICYGHQLLAKMLGGDVRTGEMEYGPASLSVLRKDELFEGANSAISVWMSHTDNVTTLPKGAKTIARTPRCKNAAFGDFDRKIFGVQFHPEVAHSEFGANLLANFARRICRIRSKEEIGNQVEHLIEMVKEKAGKNSVFFFVSGGVDSTVAFALCARALPKERLMGVYVDTGLMRKGETNEFHLMLAARGLSDRLLVRDESRRFLSALAGKHDPEEKRRIIGQCFVDVQREAMREYGIDEDHWLLGQGTIYPDTIESGGKTGKAALIKTHHNRCEEIRHLIEKGRVIEPLADFYKDEVRHLGEALGLDRHLTQRWPFPGPGLAIRCLCIKGEGSDAQHFKLPKQYSAYEAISVPISSVGVQGDTRTYRQVVAIRGPLDFETQQALSTTICNSDKLHNRVIHLISARFPDFAGARAKGNVFIDDARLSTLREADSIAREVMEAHGLMDSVWQFPVVLIPLTLGNGESIVLRPVNSQDGMTANFARIQKDVLKEIGDRILDRLSSVDAVFLDITDKPPATIEWE